MRANRMVWLMAGIALLFAVLASRLAWLQHLPAAAAGSGGDVRQKAVDQRRTDIVLDEGRGRIVDRAGRPLAGIPTGALLALPAGWGAPAAGEAAADGKAQTDGEKLADGKRAVRLPGLPPDDLAGFPAADGVPALLFRPGEREPAAPDRRQASAVAAPGGPRLVAVPYVRRYRDPPAAAHLIGFVQPRGRIGAAGLERRFEPFLRSRGARKLAFYRTATGEPLAGLAGRLVSEGSELYPLVLTATLDLALQRRAERLLAETGIEDGAVVILEVPSGDILAMASAPAFDPYHVDPQDGRWRNRALVAEPPGSVFKTAVAAAALDAGAARPGEAFHCGGKHPVSRTRCRLPRGHGRITLEEAYAQSCNVVFAELALRLGAWRLQQAAERYGIGRPAGWRAERVNTPLAALRNFAQLDGEEAGRLFAPGALPDDLHVVALSGIGQHSVRLTPLQAAQWTAAIAAGGGRLPAPRAVSRISWQNGRTLHAFPAKTWPGTGFSGASARWLRQAMALAATRGTAARLAGVPGGAAGKTGTAETGRDGLVHQWFTGFYPRDNPRYAVAILARNRPANSTHLATEAAEKLFRAWP